MSKTNPKVDWYFTKDTRWKKEYVKLREIALSCGLSEELKWGNPCYTLDGKNIVLIHGFKEYCAYLFFKGSLMKDPKGILIQQTENVQGPRQVRFTTLKEIEKLARSLKTYIQEAIKIEKAGTKVPLKKTSEFKMTEELEQKFKQMPKLKTAFGKLTPGRQRGYLLYFSSAKQAKTREARIDKYVDQILAGKGVDD
ncbi:MAG TPA: YdeI/OmpD-associated family protein [Candidatus Kapabacteria bacterium]|nr:YdeI/OmpD-associated family protein [Candidatus Kapabacteria bacterium]